MASDLYAQDFIGWTEQQARLLRDGEAELRALGLDVPHLVEQVEGIGRRERTELGREVRRAVVNMLKIEGMR